MQLVLWALFCAILYLATIITGACCILKKSGISFTGSRIGQNGLAMGKGRTMGKWIDINVIPPQIYDTVLIRVVDAKRYAETDVGFINEHGEWTTFNDWEVGSSITHWMPMPYPDLE